jgi:hypothetical protein
MEDGDLGGVCSTHEGSYEHILFSRNLKGRGHVRDLCGGNESSRNRVSSCRPGLNRHRARYSDGQ